MIHELRELQLGQVIAAIAGLGTAAFGLVEAAKPVFGGINRAGWKHIRQVVSGLAPESAGATGPLNGLAQGEMLKTLEANWVNGVDLVSQKSIAKSLIKLHLNSSNAAAVADRAGVDPERLGRAAALQAAASPLSPAESDAFSRFDLILTALLDEAYQSSEQVYRNFTRSLAACAAVALAIAGGWSLDGGGQFWSSPDAILALLAGLLATPLAPVAKDLSTALATAVDTLQMAKRQGGR
ncbi:MAG: hypothetical protein ACP5FH_01785 [Terracidiphilus sp.]